MITVRGLKFLALLFSLCITSLAAVLGGGAIADGLGDPAAGRVLRYIGFAIAVVGFWSGAMLLILLALRAIADDDIPVGSCCDHEPTDDAE